MASICSYLSHCTRIQTVLHLGPVVCFYLGRTPVILLGTAQAAWDLLDKRSEIYSGRPRSIMAYVLWLSTYVDH
ncbi:hypothetical protein BD414DRAFT_527269 [Trametes punicea]|nr:hypothetical protein BD414DRAFT_527269 [Trametes punicea]